jgi:hypothetical protein
MFVNAMEWCCWMERIYIEMNIFHLEANSLIYIESSVSPTIIFNSESRL